MHTLTKFSLIEFHEIFDRLREHIAKKYNRERGKRSQYQGNDVVFMSLTVCTHSGQWDFLDKMFNIKGPTFERLIMNFIKLLSDYAYNVYVVAAADSFDMTTFFRNKSVFRTYGTARYAAVVTFRQTDRPRGNMEEAKPYYSCKQKLCEYNTEVSVLPNGLAIVCSNHYVGSTKDVDILYRNMLWHKRHL